MMMIIDNELFDKLNKIDDLMLAIDIKIKTIDNKLDELIKALHDYDGYDDQSIDNSEDGDEWGEAMVGEAK